MDIVQERQSLGLSVSAGMAAVDAGKCLLYTTEAPTMFDAVVSVVYIFPDKDKQEYIPGIAINAGLAVLQNDPISWPPSVRRSAIQSLVNLWGAYLLAGRVGGRVIEREDFLQTLERVGVEKQKFVEFNDLLDRQMIFTKTPKRRYKRH